MFTAIFLLAFSLLTRALNPMKLTPYQQAVADHHQDHALCIAVAGSGKTTTLAQLVSNLLDRGVEPRRLMVMMFNKAAQIDFTSKLSGTAHPVLPEIRTYHATGLKLLRTLESWQVREPYNKRPLSEKMVELQIRSLILQLAPDAVKERMRSDAARLIEHAITFVESVKAHLTTPQQWFEQCDLSEEHRYLPELFHQFEQWRHQQRSITFTDMLYDPVMLIEAQPELLPRVANKMDFIVVDEYQDTSTLQHRFTQLIAGQRARMVVVGDPDQTIYEFAGANIENILRHFQADYGHTATVQELTLPHTFRYGHSIALAASHLISHNQARKNVVCIAHPDNPPSLIRVSQLKSDDSRSVVTALTEYLAAGTPVEDLAILVRVWAQSVPIELNLLEVGIGYSSSGPSPFQRPEIATLIDAMTLASGGFSALAPELRQQLLYRLLTLPHVGIKHHHIDWLCGQLQHTGQNIGQTLGTLASKITDISRFQASKLAKRAELWGWLEQNGANQPAYALMGSYVQRTNMYDSLRSMSLNDQRTQEQILAIKGFVRFLRQLNLPTTQCCQHIADLIERRQQRHHSHHGITLSSCHRAKGLEWPVVLIPGLTRQYWPFLREDESAGGPATIESERRLLYVAMTRAKQQLHLFTAEGNLARAGKSRNDISPFVPEMHLPHVLALSSHLHEQSDETLLNAIEKSGLTPISTRYISSARPQLAELLQQLARNQLPAKGRNARTTKKHSGNGLSATENNDDLWRPSAIIDHAIFGRGEVVEVNDANFSVRFDNHQHGIKRFARIAQIRHLFRVASG